jgi:hypothetical protein
MPEPKVQQQGEELDDLAFLGREFLTWLVYKADRGESTFDDVAFVFGGKARLQGLTGDLADAVLKGRAPALGIETRAALGAGRTVREAELRVTQGEREFRFTLVADTLDLRAVKLPALLKEEDDDRLLERISLLEELDGFVKQAYQEFLRERTRPVWTRTVIPAMRGWLVESLSVDEG